MGRPNRSEGVESMAKQTEPAKSINMNKSCCFSKPDQGAFGRPHCAKNLRVKGWN